MCFFYVSSRYSILFIVCFSCAMFIDVPYSFTKDIGIERFNNSLIEINESEGVCGFGKLYESFLKSKIKVTLPTREHLIKRGKLDILGNTILDDVGQEVDFWTHDFYSDTEERIYATCKAVGQHCYIYVDNVESMEQSVIDNIKTEYDSNIYPTDRVNFGSEWKPGIDGDDKVTILIYNIKDDNYYGKTSWYIAGYFNPVDETQGGHSNEREMLYMDCNPAVPGSNKFYGTIAHEFQHLIHWNQDRNEETWVNEGCSEYAEFICGYGGRSPNHFFSNPDNNLVEWNGELSDYEQCFLLILYLYEQYGGASTITQLVREQADGIQGIENTINSKGYSITFGEIFSNWIVANYLDDISINNGIYGYHNMDLSSITIQYDNQHDLYPTSSSGSVSQWAADYIEFTNGSDVTFTYNGPSSSWLIETGTSRKNVEYLTGFKRITNFGDLYDKVILVAYGLSNGGNYSYTATSYFTDLPNLTLYTESGSYNIFRYDSTSHVCEFDVSIQNNGTAHSDRYEVGFYLSSDTLISTGDYLVGSLSEQVLNFGDHVNLSYTNDLDELNLPDGIYFAGYYIDYLNSNIENNENDNMGYWSSPQVIWDSDGHDVVNVWIEKNLTCGCDIGDTLVVPIKIDNVTGKEIYSYGIEIMFNSSDLECMKATSIGTITSEWGSPIVNIGAGWITLASAGAIPLSGSSHLVTIYLKSVKIHDSGQKVLLHINNVQFNEGIPSSKTSDGLVTFQSYANISGTVKYFQGASPISNVTVNLSGGATKNTTTGAPGTYEFTNLTTGQNYNVTASKTRSASREDAISAFDASYVLRYYVGSLSLSEAQKIAADASGNGEVTAFDASIILRYYVGQDVSQYDIAKWKFYVPPLNNWSSPNTTRNYSPFNSNQTNQDFEGILVGDVTGNWTASVLSKAASSSLVFGEAVYNAENLFELPVRVEGVSSCYSIGIEMDIKGLVCEDVKPFMESDKIVVVHHEDTGKLRIALAGSEELQAGTLLKVLFRAKDEDMSDDVSLTVTSYEVDANRVAGIEHEVLCKTDDILPVTYDLLQNYPNPFNPQTVISYSLPEPSDITLIIYNISGKRVVTLEQSQKSAGYHSVTWDGRDSYGRLVSGGVYLCRFQAGTYSQTIRMLLMK